MLFYSNFLSVGKSRGIGLGEVKVYGSKVKGLN
jgi:CRISPR/Cas system endoribonuclease Cas6 (RAMP superfamily)